MITWNPDTCGCKFEVINQETFDCRPLHKCEAHSNVADDQIMAVVHVDENQAKNKLLGVIKEVLGVSADDNTRDNLIDFEFDNNRKISFHIKDLNEIQRTAIMTRLAKSNLKDRLKDLLIRK